MATLELLAPAGGEAALRAAVQSGADAVYLGGPEFSARRGADNFSVDDIKRYADYCHLYGVDVHVAVNTLIKEKEIPALIDYVYTLNNAGVDALIIQDIGAAEIIHEILPDMTLHASTQMTVTSLEGVKYLEKMGFSRVVLARELSCDEIKYICDNTDVEIEVFVHGAICMSYSGQCLMSSILGGRSGNRGCCAQPCRLPYCITDGNSETGTKYFLSPKDMALVENLNELKQIGVKSLKIEGRLKRAEYVSTVVGIYRKYLDNLNDKVSLQDIQALTDAFSRSGFTNGYFTGKLGKNMMSHVIPGNNSENSFTKEALARCADNANFRKIPIGIIASMPESAPLEITIYDFDNNYITVSGEACSEKALNKPLDEERLKEQLSKLGNTPFIVNEITVSVDEGITIPVKEINYVRRIAVDRLIEARMFREKGRVGKIEKSSLKKSSDSKQILVVQVNDDEQLKAALNNGIDVIYASERVRKISNSATFITKMPDIFDKTGTKNDSVLVSSTAAAEFYSNKNLHGDFRLNIFNSFSANHFKHFESVTISPELNIGEIRALIKNTEVSTELIAYGHLPLMLMRNCPLKAAGKCQNGKRTFKLKDRKNQEFGIMCQENCNAVLLNSKPIYMADKLNDLLDTGVNRIRLMFTTESYAECDRIIKEYKKAFAGEKVHAPAENTFTRGHYYRGVQ